MVLKAKYTLESISAEEQLSKSLNDFSKMIQEEIDKEIIQELIRIYNEKNEKQVLIETSYNELSVKDKIKYLMKKIGYNV